jgi:hypothetical protein
MVEITKQIWNMKQFNVIRKQEGMHRIIKRHCRAQAAEASSDFYATAGAGLNEAQSRANREPYDWAIREFHDRIVGQVRTSTNPARRHEKRTSSLLRVVARNAGGF